MPSPFPGMDPYVDRPDRWHQFYRPLAVYACDALQGQLPHDYLARLAFSHYSDPTLNFLDEFECRWEPRPGTLKGHWIEARALVQKDVWVEIQYLPENTTRSAVEFVNFSARCGTYSRAQYQERQAKRMASGVCAVEIDLLRTGQHVVAPPSSNLAHLEPYEYVISIYRRWLAIGFEVFTGTLREPLPTIPVPLSLEHGEVSLDLQALVSHAYDTAAMGKLINYRDEPPVPLPASHQAWADKLLRNAGLRGEPGA
jgi:hypothetical protein